MKIQTKYNLNQKVWVTSVFSNNNEVIYAPREVKIYSIECGVNNDGTQTNRYHCTVNALIQRPAYPEDYLSNTEKQCKEMCKILNRRYATK